MPGRLLFCEVAAECDGPRPRSPNLVDDLPAFASSISATATAAPSRANSRAVAAPIPPAPPVTIATFPASLDIEFSQRRSFR
jgi:hypothetical protein